MELDELHDQLATVRGQLDAAGGIATVAAIQEALTQAENELDSILHQFQAGSANMISVQGCARFFDSSYLLASTFPYCL